MKKVLAIVLAVVMLLPVFAVNVSAAVAYETAFKLIENGVSLHTGTEFNTGKIGWRSAAIKSDSAAWADFLTAVQTEGARFVLKYTITGEPGKNDKGEDDYGWFNFFQAIGSSTEVGIANYSGGAGKFVDVKDGVTINHQWELLHVGEHVVYYNCKDFIDLVETDANGAGVGNFATYIKQLCFQSGQPETLLVNFSDLYIEVPATVIDPVDPSREVVFLYEFDENIAYKGWNSLFSGQNAKDLAAALAMPGSVLTVDYIADVAASSYVQLSFEGDETCILSGGVEKSDGTTPSADVTKQGYTYYLSGDAGDHTFEKTGAEIKANFEGMNGTVNEGGTWDGHQVGGTYNGFELSKLNQVIFNYGGQTVDYRFRSFKVTIPKGTGGDQPGPVNPPVESEDAPFEKATELGLYDNDGLIGTVIVNKPNKEYTVSGTIGNPGYLMLKATDNNTGAAETSNLPIGAQIKIKKIVTNGVTATTSTFDPVNVGEDHKVAIWIKSPWGNGICADACQVGNITVTFEVVDPNATPTASDSIATLIGHTLSLSGNIAVNFYMQMDESLTDFNNVYMKFTLSDGTETTMSYSEAVSKTVNDVECRVFTCKVHATQMSQIITATMYNGNTAGTSHQYSVKEYFDNQQDTADAKLTSVIDSMKNYGAASQIYFNSTDPIVSGLGTIEDPDPNVLAPFATQYNPSADSLGITSKSMTLVLFSETSIRFYFNLSEGSAMTDYTFTVTDTAENEVYYEINEESKYLEIPNIGATKLDEMYTVTANKKDGGAQAFTISYSAFSYIKNKLNDTDPKLVDVVKALYAYNRAAENYAN